MNKSKQTSCIALFGPLLAVAALLLAIAGTLVHAQVPETMFLET